MSTALLSTHFPSLTLVSKGKVRDIYSTHDPSTLLVVATDRISVFDVILNNGVPRKGVLLTQISLLWFQKLRDIIPNHLVTADVDEMPEEVRQYRDQLDQRTMLVKKATVVPIEAIVRGYLTGSAWAEYRKTGTVHGIPQPPGLLESQKFIKPLFTPSTKAEAGAHDENLHPDQASELIGKDLYDRIQTVSLQLYERASSFALSRGLILADTKFEFGLLPASSEPSLILIDEALTPDSSRYWPLATYEAGRAQESFDKQYVRDYLLAQGYKKGMEGGKDGTGGWSIESSVIEGTTRRYEEALHLLSFPD